jgi:Predicted ornithine cyclodeaminase, mu-crystallin homolog
VLNQNVRVITVEDMKHLLHKVSLKTFMLKLIDQLESDYSRWNEFQKSPRHAIHYPHGVIELMPISDKKYYSFKYVNGHPKNPLQGHQTVVATGQFSDVASGYPILISEMTLLTAIRTAATSALASKYLAHRGAKTFGIIGTGAQSEFQTLAHYFALGIEEIFYFDIDPHAMEKFAKNLKSFDLKLHPCKDGRSVVEKSEIITSATAAAGHLKIISADWVKKGTHVNGIGGDSPGKTELDISLLERSKVVVELIEQTKIEGEIQQMKKNHVYAELWEIICKKKPGRESEQEITLFDSVGFALEDYSALRLVNDLAEEYKMGHMLDLIPHPKDPKNLFGVIL